jgi:hypothetical protein
MPPLHLPTPVCGSDIQPGYPFKSVRKGIFKAKKALCEEFFLIGAVKYGQML